MLGTIRTSRRKPRGSGMPRGNVEGLGGNAEASRFLPHRAQRGEGHDEHVAARRAHLASRGEQLLVRPAILMLVERNSTLTGRAPAIRQVRRMARFRIVGQ